MSRKTGWYGGTLKQDVMEDGEVLWPTGTFVEVPASVKREGDYLVTLEREGRTYKVSVPTWDDFMLMVDQGWGDAGNHKER